MCVDCSTTNMTYKCWYGEDGATDAHEWDIFCAADSRGANLSLLKGASAFSKKVNAQLKSSNT